MYIVKEDSKFKFWTLLERTESSVLGRQLTVDGPNQMVKVTWQSKGDTGQQLQFLRYFFHQSRLKLKPIKIFTIWFSIVRSSDVVVVGSMKCLFNMKGGIHTIKSLWRWILWKTSNRVKIQIWWDSAQVQPLSECLAYDDFGNPVHRKGQQVEPQRLIYIEMVSREIV